MASSSTYKRSLSFGPGDYDHEDRSVPKPRVSRSTSILTSAVLNWLASPASGHHRRQPAAVPSNEPDESNKQEEVWMQACYNAVVLVFVFISGCIFLAVYYVLEPFLHPLIWAILIGTFLHPFKRTSTSVIKEWVNSLETRSIPLSVGLVLSPVFLFNSIAQYFEYLATSYWKFLLYFGIGAVCLWLVYVFEMPRRVYSFVEVTSFQFERVDSIMIRTGILQLCSLAVGFVVLLILSRRSEYTTALKILSVSLWFLAFVNITAYLLGSALVPPMVALFVSAAVLSFYQKVKDLFTIGKPRLTQMRKMRSGEEARGEEKERGVELEGSLLERGITQKTAESVSEDLGDNMSIDIEKGEEGSASGKGKSSSEMLESAQIDGQESSEVKEDLDAGGWMEGGDGGPVEDDKQLRTVSFGPVVTQPEVSLSREKVAGAGEDRALSQPEASEGGTDEVDARFRLATRRVHPMDARELDIRKAGAQSSQVFLLLLVICLIVTFWKYPFLLLLLAPFALWILIKHVLTLAVVQQSALCQLPAMWSGIQTWIDSRKEVLFPSPLPTLLKMYIIADNKVLSAVKRSLGSLMSMCIIVGLMTTGLATFILLIFEIQVELSHYVNVSATVWNRTVANHPQLIEWMGGGEGNETFQDTLGEFANQGYAYGREWLAHQVHSLASDSSGNTSVVEKRVMDMVDQLYQSYFLKNTSSLDIRSAAASSHGSEQGGDSDRLWVELKTLATDNLETILAVLKSVWLLMSENVTLAFSLLYALLQLLFSGGTTLLNLIVFITALFYLLCYSEEDYLPVKWVMDLLPHLTAGSGEDYGKAFSKAIGSVFHASLRRAFFYGLYTWLIHTMFGLSVSILPSVLAAIAGAIPFVGPYWVAMPAVLEVWLVDGKPVASIAILTLSLLPAFFIDSIINREIEGGHPYLTGLAIAGGIYFAGLEGALIGPILLCCLLFVVDLYGDMLNN